MTGLSRRSAPQVQRVNAAGHMIGWLPRCLVFDGEHLTDLGTLDGAADFNSRPSGINSRGQVVGGAYLSTVPTFHANLYENGTMRDLGTLNLANGWTSEDLKLHELRSRPSASRQNFTVIAAPRRPWPNTGETLTLLRPAGFW